MQLDKILDVIISKEAYKEVKVECKLPYHPFELVRNTVEKIKTLLSFYEGQGNDIHDPDVFDEIVEKARQDLGERIKNHNEERLNHFATLFKEAIDKDLVIG